MHVDFKRRLMVMKLLTIFVKRVLLQQTFFNTEKHNHCCQRDSFAPKTYGLFDNSYYSPTLRLFHQKIGKIYEPSGIQKDSKTGLSTTIAGVQASR